MKRILCFALLIGLISHNLFAQTPEEKGLAIAVESERRDTGFGDYMAEATMILKNRQGKESVRHLRRKTLEVLEAGDKSMDFFDKPRDIKGTTVLTFSHGLEPDDQWVYLPALKRVKRISSVNKSGPFMGSEFAYEDLSSEEVDKYTYRYLRDESLDGQECFVSETVPVYPHSGYVRRIVWMDKVLYQPRKVVYYDRKNVLLKTLMFRDYHQYVDRYWRASEMAMENHQTGKSTRLVWNGYRFQTGLTDQDFTATRLRRGR